MNDRPVYGGGTLDRAQSLRHAAAWPALLRDPRTRFVAFWRGLHAFDESGMAARRFDPAVVLPLIEAHDPPAVLLGVEAAGQPLVALDLSLLEGDDDNGPLIDGLAPAPARWRATRTAAPALPADEAALLALTRGMLLWRARTRFCPVCGTRLIPVEAGTAARCAAPACATTQFPRTDPAVIVLVTDPSGRALLGRQSHWSPGLVSCLAGFVEPGETLEEAAAREVAEEVGVRISGLRYVASQPWPFPSSLMVGFFAEAPAGDPVPDRREIETARWFSRAEVARFGEAGTPGPDGFALPARDSIARLLIEAWRRS